MRWFRLVSLRLQVIVLVVSFTLAVGLGNVFRAHLALEDLAREQFERRSVATALGLAAQASDLVLTGDLFGLYDLLNSTLVNTPDVRYILVLDAGGGVRAHTFGPGIPRGLAAANTVLEGEPWRVRRLNTEEGEVVDVAVPLPEEAGGVLRLGMSQQVLQATINRHTTHLLGLAAASLLPVLLVTYILGRALTQPLLKLVEVTNAIRQGDWSRKAPTNGRDEVARLGQSFNAMTEALVQSQTALQARNEELAALYAIATTTAHLDTVDSLLEAALTKSLEVMGLRTGWIFLAGNEGDGEPVLRAARGLPAGAEARLAEDCLPVQPAVLEEAVIAHNGQPCPCLPAGSADDASLCHAAVPLRSRARMWGTMHLACPAPGCFTPSHLQLLTAIGRQVGVAIENVRLAEIERREAFQRRLLEQVIGAQEEERKRIARELHDELAQNLAALSRELESVAQTPAIASPPLQSRIRDTRTLTLRLLEQTRRLIFDLRPPALDDLGLLPAIRRYARHHLDEAGVALHLRTEGAKRRLPPAVETALFRIAQEAITNVVRHARASRVILSLRFAPACITLTVTDDGVGFTPSPPWTTGDGGWGVGLLGMRERAELLGGRLTLDARPGAGTTVQVDIPLEEA
ncbi:MAG: HAMP domain-containing protein [Caldilineae bacterium]|nr:MAG: HAMP domain-containing protein [Caldilineae bacterium]